MGALKIPRKQKRKNKDKTVPEKSESPDVHTVHTKVPKLMPKLLPKDDDVNFEPSESVEQGLPEKTDNSNETRSLSPETSVTKISVITSNDPEPISIEPKNKETKVPNLNLTKIEAKKKNFCNPGPSWIPGPKPKTQVKAFGRCMKVNYHDFHLLNLDF